MVWGVDSESGHYKPDLHNLVMIYYWMKVQTRYRMMYPTINHGGTNNNGNTKQQTTFRNDRDIVFDLSI